MKANENRKIETNLLLEAIYQKYGYDFRHYARTSINRRVKHFIQKNNCDRATELIPKLLEDELFFHSLLGDLSITVTEMFRDPWVYQQIRQEIIPYLKTYPFVRVWLAGCATGEEAYSLAILLQEEGLYERTTIFATDMYDESLQKAKEGVYPQKLIRQYTTNYHKTGGGRSFAEYYHAMYDSVIMNKSLGENITFARHNLVTDGVFGEMHLIMCRNVLIYFNKELQEQVFKLFSDSLIRGGILCLGSKESLQFSEVFPDFEEAHHKAKLYKKII